MNAVDRRELVLEAATVVFGERGYAGTTTDQVAKAAGVSQPYVVRMFGTKEELFLSVLRRDLARLLDSFRAVLANDPVTNIHHRLGAAYIDMVSDRGILLSLMHGFILGADPVIGKVAREGFMDVYRLLRDEAGFTADQVESFLAHGMLINTLVGIRLTDDYASDADARELLDIAIGDKLPMLEELAREPRA
jgi:AcrR family transcriptional regulator